MKTTAGNHGEVAKGRGSPINPEGRFESHAREATDDGWFQEPEANEGRPRTVVAIERAKSVITRNDSPDLGFSQSINPYRGCEHGCTYCAWGGTPILLANGRTLPLSELRVGDEIYGTTFDGKYRRYTRTRVLAHWSSIHPAFMTVLEDGTELVTSGNHRFLTERGWKYVADAARPGQRPHLTTSNRMLGVGQFAEGPREDSDYRRGYVCGMVRGDAHVYPGLPTGARLHPHRYPAFRLALCDDPALLRTQQFLLDFDIPTTEFRFQEAVGNREVESSPFETLQNGQRPPAFPG
jgi:hypothetical protein